MPDPLHDLITRYRAQIAIFNAAPIEGDDANNALAAGTYMPLLNELFDHPPAPTSYEGAIAGLEFVSTELKDHACSDGHRAILSTCLDFLRDVDRKPLRAAAALVACPVAALGAQVERVLAARAEIERLDGSRATTADRVHAEATDDLLCGHQQRLVDRVLTTKASSLIGAVAQLPIATAFVEELYDSYTDDSWRTKEIIGMLRLALYSISAVVHAEAGVSLEARLPEYFMPARNDPHERLASALALR